MYKQIMVSVKRSSRFVLFVSLCKNIWRGIVFKKGLNWFALVFLNMTYEGEHLDYYLHEVRYRERVIVI